MNPAKESAAKNHAGHQPISPTTNATTKQTSITRDPASEPTTTVHLATFVSVGSLPVGG
jgi:hypothetical protein